jgi:hypothetical protein
VVDRVQQEACRALPLVVNEDGQQHEQLTEPLRVEEITRRNRAEAGNTANGLLSREQVHRCLW